MQEHLHTDWPSIRAITVFGTIKVPDIESTLFTDDSES